MVIRRLGLLLLGLSACGDSAENSQVEREDAGVCVPSEVGYASVRPLFVAYCGTCHGDVPSGGAPFSLLDYDTLVTADATGVRPVDRIGGVLANQAMPPGDQPQPGVHERAALAAWATCDDVNLHDAGAGHDDGGVTHEHDGGGLPDKGPLMASRDPITVSDAPPASAVAVTMTLDEFTPPATGDHYESRVFSNFVSEPRFIRYFEPVIDDARVVHHLTLRFAGSRRGYVYTWAPGASAMEFPDGGILIGPDDELRVEVHYHNGVGATDVADSSGVRLYVDEPVGTEYGLANLATWDIYVPAQSTAEAHETCNVTEPVHVFAAWPHMHEVGDAVEHTIVHAGGGEEILIDLTGWSFHSQRIYAVGVDLAAGDRLDLTCRYRNPTDRPIGAGSATTDEMCFDFLYVTPAHALDGCNDTLSQ